MTNKKFIVKGCPCIHKIGSCAGITASFYCEDEKKCKMKLIATKLKMLHSLKTPGSTISFRGVEIFAEIQKLLQVLDVQEVEK